MARKSKQADKEYGKAYYQEYKLRPEVIERTKERRANRKKQLAEYQKQYRKRPGVKEKVAAYLERPEVKERMKNYRREYAKANYLNKLDREKREADHCPEFVRCKKCFVNVVKACARENCWMNKEKNG